MVSKLEVKEKKERRSTVRVNGAKGVLEVAKEADRQIQIRVMHTAGLQEFLNLYICLCLRSV